VTYRLQFTPKAIKELDKLDKGTVRRIRRFFGETLDRENPRSRGQPLQHRDEWRYRVGDYRILCKIDDGALTVLVVKVAHRREAYR
jgi:mRNA interferase RelE/StbE